MSETAHSTQPDDAEALFEQFLGAAYTDLAEAESIAIRIEHLAAGDDERIRALALRARGHLHLKRANYAEAVRCYESALDILSNGRFEMDIGRTLASGMQALIYLARYDQAESWAVRARAIFEANHDDLRLARLLSNLGNIRFRLDRHAEAIVLYREAAAALRESGAPRDLGAVLSNLATCYTSLADFPAALAAYIEARAYCAAQGLDQLVAEADYNIAWRYYLSGDYRRAVELYAATRVHFRMTGDAYHAALCDLDESELYLDLNLSEAGRRLARSAVRRFAALGMGYERAKATVNLARAAAQRCALPAALRLFRAARRLFTAERNPFWPAVIDHEIARILQETGRTNAARRLNARAAAVLAGSGLPARAALCDLLDARILGAAGQNDAARRACARAWERLGGGGAAAVRFHIRLLQGQIEEAARDWGAARAFYLQARDQVEQLLPELDSEESLISFRRDKLTVYESLAWLCLQQDPPDFPAAFRYVEEAKSRSLASLLDLPGGASGVQRFWQSDADLLNLRRELRAVSRQIEEVTLRAAPGYDARLQNLERQARQREDAIAHGVAELRGDPVRGPNVFGGGVLPLEAVMAAMPADAMLLQFALIRGLVYVFLVSRRRIELVPLTDAASLRSHLRLFSFQMSRSRLSGSLNSPAPTGRAIGVRLRELYAMLIEPIRHLLDARHLVIAPSGPLHNLPFHALSNGVHALIDDFTVSYAPNASVFAWCSQRPPVPHTRSLVLGVPDPRAPFIEDEARSAAALLPEARLFLGADATEDVLRREGPGNRFIHLATHGLFRSDNPLFSSLRLGASQLSVIDLYGMSLDASLVTLSGCSTGLNVVRGGDELFGLLRGLLAAGAHGILVSLWDVHDRSAADFMTRFYRHGAVNPNRAEALRLATLEQREAYPDPYHWAPFVLVGKYRD